MHSDCLQIAFVLQQPKSESIFRLQKNSENFYWQFPFGKSAFHLRQVPFEGAEGRRLKDRERYGTGDKNNKDDKSVNGTQIFHWEDSTGKTGLPFQEFRLFGKISSGTNQTFVFIYIPIGIFGIFW